MPSNKGLALSSLTIFLIKDDVRGIEEILSDLTPENKLTIHDVRIVNLRQAWKTLKGFGYRVALTKIDVKDGLVRKPL